MDDKVKELLDRIRDTAAGAADAANRPPGQPGKGRARWWMWPS